MSRMLVPTVRLALSGKILEATSVEFLLPPGTARKEPWGNVSRRLGRVARRRPSPCIQLVPMVAESPPVSRNSAQMH